MKSKNTVLIRIIVFCLVTVLITLYMSQIINLLKNTGISNITQLPYSFGNEFIPFDSKKHLQNKTLSLTVKDNLSSIYQTALNDAQNAEIHEIDKNLIAISDQILNNEKHYYNHNNIKDQEPPVWAYVDIPNKDNENESIRQKMVLGCALTTHKGYNNYLNKVMLLERDVFITVVPELKRFCIQSEIQDHDKLQMRLSQLLGLPYPLTEEKRFIVELFVDPSNLFRPCPDPEISDYECELDFPSTSNRLIITGEHVKWLNDYLRNPTLLSRLGYTFDWGDLMNERGLSEFVINKGSEVFVHSITPLTEYCK
eukprot:TRINITY_DN16473_c0_g1_i1.p1 TRINITY_DN16473_c0_g1~~TRINITY_DN16473_c0_g1_i1.p1  ORF type:complete len:311 (+),score=44.76 TRINITY_DN16473_c0_g1_i1:130-1062(+)